jgi:hypothetical protein
MRAETMYTVQRCRKDDSLYGPTHASKYAENTLCGLNVNHNWYIVNNTFDGEVTCKKCIEIMERKK